MNDWTGGNPFLGANNPFLQQNIDNSMQDVTRAYGQRVKPQTETAMANSGSFGNSGLMQLQAEQERQLGATLGQVSSGMRMQDYNQQQGMYKWDQEYNRGLFNDAFGQNQQNMSNAMGLMGQQSQFGQQDINNATTMWQQPMQYMQQFGQMANAAGGMGGTATAATQMPGSPVMGAMGGWGLGGQLASYFK